jgi:nucleotide-binding universal stress UspA family protein
MYNKLLVPIDGSPQSNHAAKRAIELAKLTGAEITFIHIIVPITQYFSFSGEGPLAVSQDMLDQTEKAGKKLLKEQVECYADSGVKISKELFWGHPSETICTRAKEEKFDLIIMGSRGLGAIKGYLLGSVSDRVAHHAPCSVLIVH